eukprot:Protomagalhaensia_wolfi_Nauph_80__209@NODE_1112_length_1725_cov_356_102610_g796_i1_p2_GENE_NODE_1112_length_1725_cov_356_102610_g796_i1NODE_1112_length_1725_cov_356_102610_g796_i1_p2_ORF_typecomplete_len144_score37_28AHSA1/PF08327_11/1_3e08AHL_synthase/PF17327_2/0_13_NODE_1112_length_1725_cov_356_102610_g796_i110951526
MTSIESSLVFNVPPRIIYQSLATEEGLTRLALGKPTKFPEEQGAHYSLLNGEFTGKIEALESNAKIQLTMKRQGWSSYSHVTIKLSPFQGREDRTLVELTQTDIPVLTTELAAKSEAAALWEAQFWNILDKVFGYGRDSIETD